MINKNVFITCCILALSGYASMSRAQISESCFRFPPMAYRPYVWWHWMGSNFSLYGINKDLEVMKEVGIGGATIFNISSAVQETCAPTENNPWPWQTYRSKYYWDALEYACSEAQRLGIELGLHNSVGYSTTGGPWITEEQGMKQLICSKLKIVGGHMIDVKLPSPYLPAYRGWGASGEKCPSIWHNINVIAMPCVGNKMNQIDLTMQVDTAGRLRWKAPAGKWILFRMGYAATMSRPHPVPDELIGKTLEVDKIDSTMNQYHWNQVLQPLEKNIGKYFETSFRHVLIDSYEAGKQNWSQNMSDDFIRLKGYSPCTWLPYVMCADNDSLSLNKEILERFKWDLKDVVARLYQTNGWEIARRMTAKYGLKLQQEPYEGPFSCVAGAASADLPMGEFWTSSNGMISTSVSGAARAAGKTIIGAEAYTSRPEMSQWTEDPAMLKRSTEGAFASGVNHLVLHQWVHQPFDDCYQPGISMGWWGTHFGRNQTWIEPAKAFFHYIARCQYLLQQGQQVVDFLALDTPTDYLTDAIATPDFLSQKVEVVHGKIKLQSGREYSLLEIPHNKGIMLPEVLQKIKQIINKGAIVITEKPVKSPSLTDYPQCDRNVSLLSDSLWKEYHGKRIFDTREEAIKALKMMPDYIMHGGTAQIVHRQTSDADIYYIGNITNQSQHIVVSLRTAGRLPELWNAENGSIGVVKSWKSDAGHTNLVVDLSPMQSRFVVMRRVATAKETAEGLMVRPNMLKKDSLIFNNDWFVHFCPRMDSAFNSKFNTLSDFSFNSDNRIKYFSGTATYKKTIKLKRKQLAHSDEVWIDLGRMNDIATLTVNGFAADTLWYPPYRTDISKFIKSGKNDIVIKVTNNWANCLIGDEQSDADFEWGVDRGLNMGRAIKGYPSWFIKNTPRPNKNRRCFTVWNYFRKDSKLQKAGLDGPVMIEFWKLDSRSLKTHLDTD